MCVGPGGHLYWGLVGLCALPREQNLYEGEGMATSASHPFSDVRLDLDGDESPLLPVPGPAPTPAIAGRHMTTTKPWSARHPALAVLIALLMVTLGVWSVNLVNEYRGVDRARDFWSVPQGQSGGLLYVALGDSTAQGVGASRPDRGYVGLVAEQLRRQSGQQVMVINLSVSGARIQDVLDVQLPRLRALRADVVTVAIGANDVRSYDTAQFARRATEMTAALPGGTFIADVPWFMAGAWEGNASEAGEVLVRTAGERGLPVVPLHHALLARGWTSMLTDFAPDWFHPNDRGYRVWAGTFWKAICAENRRAPRPDLGLRC